MSVEQLNKVIQSLSESNIDPIVTLSKRLMELMGIAPLSQKETIINASSTLQNMLVEDNVVKGQQLFFELTNPNQPIKCRLAVVKKINKQTIYRLINENSFNSWQANIGNAGTDNLPYTIDFITNKKCLSLTVVLSLGEQLRTIYFNTRLSNIQVNKILPKWLNIAKQPKAIINEDLWSSLDIKQVNKEFYITIKERFDTLISLIKVQYPTSQPNEQKMFAIKLIGRYLFCWFLKEKEIIPTQVLSSASLSKHTNIYNHIIKPLFFITLNTLPQPEREYPNDVAEEFVNLFANIPYLNGGLFEPSEEDKLISDLQIDGWLLQFIKFLEEYHFTVDESSPNYEQLAIDPEMLGRILENLLASLNKETEKMANERKNLGAFYTPRVIVDYMVTESLKYYLLSKLLPNTTETNNTPTKEDFITTNSSKVPSLFAAQEPQQLAFNIDKLTKEDTNKETYIKAKIDKLFNVWDDSNPFTNTETQIVKEALQQCKIIDPACGSGAFPMGILHKLELLNEKLGTDKSAYKLRRFILSQNIYGVDILPIAVEISRLRAWLSLILVSDFKPKDRKHNFGIEALPNLDFKFVCANALIGSGYDEFLSIAKQSQITTLIRLNTEIQILEDIRNEYFNSSNTDNKKHELIETFDAKKEYIKQNFRLQKDKLNINEFLDKIDDWNPFNDSKASSFFSPAWMLGITDGFDIVIGNPPYIAISKLADKAILKKKNFKTFESTGDVYSLFYEIGNKILKKKGCLNFITSRQWINASYGKSTRKFFSKETNPIQLIDFGKAKIFETATVFVNILMFQNSKNQHKLNACLLPDDFKVEQTDLSNYFKNKSILLTNVNETVWKIGESDSEDLNKKIEERGIRLKDWKNIEFYAGIKTAFNPAYHINKITKDELIAKDPKNIEILKPLLRGKDIKRYGYSYKNLYLINTHNGLRSINLNPINAESDYPTIFEYLKQFEKELKNRDDQGVHWTNLRNCAFLNEFEKEKIVWIEISDRANYTYDTGGMYLTNSAYFMSGKDLKYILAVLNSTTSDFYFSQITAKIAGGRKRYTKQYVEQIPIPQINQEEQKPFVALVDNILSQKKQGIDTTAFEREIDIKVYHLYNLKLSEAQLIDATLTEAEFELYKS